MSLFSQSEHGMRGASYSGVGWNPSQSSPGCRRSWSACIAAQPASRTKASWTPMAPLLHSPLFAWKCKCTELGALVCGLKIQHVCGCIASYPIEGWHWAQLFDQGCIQNGVRHLQVCARASTSSRPAAASPLPHACGSRALPRCLRRSHGVWSLLCTACPGRPRATAGEHGRNTCACILILCYTSCRQA